MCQILKVNRSSYYHWMKVGYVVTKVDEKLNGIIKEVFENSRHTYGTRRIKQALVKRYGLITSKRRISKRMKLLNIGLLF